MSSRRGLTKLKAVLIVDFIIIATLGSTYFYLQSQNAFAPRPAEFVISDLIITPQQPDIGEPVTISYNLTNIGEVEGAYVANLTVNQIFKENQTVAVQPGETLTAQFTAVEVIEGKYQVIIGDVSGSFTVKAAPPEDTTIVLSDLVIQPREVWVGKSVSINITARNQGSENSSLTVRLMIDDMFVENQRITLSADETMDIQFSVNSTVEGPHKVRVNTFFGSFKTVPVGTHTLTVYTSPTPDEGYVEFKLNGETKRTVYSEALPEGSYTISMPSTDTTGTHAFLNWEDGNTSPTKTITLNKPTILVSYYEPGTSCPSLFIWNGTDYVYFSDVSNHGWLGYTRYVNEDGSLEYWRNNPWDYIPLQNILLQTKNGYFDMNLMQKWDEIFFVDSAYLLAVDHPSNVNVYSTMVEQYIDPNYMGKIYTVSKNPLAPISATNELVTVYNGKVVSSYAEESVLSAVSKIDGVSTTGFNGKYSVDWNNQTWNRLTLNLGDLAGTDQIKLVVNAIVDWGEPESYNLWMNKFYSANLPNHTQPTPVSYMEVKDANGNWVRVPEDRQFALPPDETARTYIVDLTGLFFTNDYSLRLNNFWNVTYDYIGIDVTPQANISIRRIDPDASLSQSFVSVSDSSGNFTKYGDVTQLLLKEDDKFVIGRQGDMISLRFPAYNLETPAAGMKRDYFFFVAAWFKVRYANYGFGPDHNGFTVDPLPFHNMSGFPYPLENETYPFDSDHLSYLREWNTRTIAQTTSEQQIFTYTNFMLTLALGFLILVVIMNYSVLRSHRSRSHLPKDSKRR